jgi:DNA-binding transcriptional LysR family regulator
MNPTLLTTFLAVAETGSFTRAARETFVTQPAVSQHIRALEEQLGVRLFVRSGQRIHLTPEGEELRRHARAAIKAIQEAELALTEMSSLARGRLRIGATMFMAYLLPPALMEFKRRHPQVRVEVRFANSAEVIRAVENGSVDFGFAGGLADRTSSLGVTPIHTERLALAAAPDHPLAGRSSIEPADLAPHMLAIRERGTYTRRRVEDWFGDVPLPANLIEVGRVEAAVQLALAGCLTFVPEGAIGVDAQAGRLVALPARGLVSVLDYDLYLFGDALPSVASRVFLELLAELPVLSDAAALRAFLAARRGTP